MGCSDLEGGTSPLVASRTVRVLVVDVSALASASTPPARGTGSSRLAEGRPRFYLHVSDRNALTRTTSQRIRLALQGRWSWALAPARGPPFGGQHDAGSGRAAPGRLRGAWALLDLDHEGLIRAPRRGCEAGGGRADGGSVRLVVGLFDSNQCASAAGYDADANGPPRLSAAYLLSS